MESLHDDSGEDLFITQTAPEYKPLEGEEDYDCSYLNSQYENNWSVPVGEVEFVDFSDQRDNSSVVPSQPIKNDWTRNEENVVEEKFDPLVAENYFGDDENVSLVLCIEVLTEYFFL